MTKNTLLIISGMLFIAVIAIILSLTMGIAAQTTYLVGVLLWMLLIPVYYKAKDYISNLRESQH